MAEEELLSSDERDALLEGVNSGAVDTASEARVAHAEVESFDLGRCKVSSRACPRPIEMVYDRFTKALRKSLGDVLRRPVEVRLDTAHLGTYASYADNLTEPTSLNVFSAEPLPRAMLLALDTPLVYAFVDQFFGGTGKLPEDRAPEEFTRVELSMVELFLKHATDDLAAAWLPLASLDFQPLAAEQNPRYASIATATESVLSAIFVVELGDASGEFHVVLPTDMLLPLKARLGNAIRGIEGQGGPAWQRALARGVRAIPLEVSSTMAETRISVRELLNLKAGDMIPIELPDTVPVRAGDTAVGSGSVGDSRGFRAIQMHDRIA